MMTDPKKIAGDKKCPMHLLPVKFLRATATALGLGAKRYGEWNWRLSEGVKAQTYIAAIRRHLAQFQEGEDIDDESGVSHLAHIAATCAILLDAESVGKLIDDRPPIVCPNMVKNDTPEPKTGPETSPWTMCSKDNIDGNVSDFWDWVVDPRKGKPDPAQMTHPLGLECSRCKSWHIEADGEGSDLFVKCQVCGYSWGPRYEAPKDDGADYSDNPLEGLQEECPHCGLSPVTENLGLDVWITRCPSKCLAGAAFSKKSSKIRWNQLVYEIYRQERGGK